MQLTVWQLIDSSSVGGIETHVVHLSRALQARGICNQIIQIKRYGDHPVFNAKENNDLTIHQLDGISATLIRCLKDKPDVIHAHGAKACLIAKFLRMISGLSIICTYHTGETATGLQGLYDRLNEYTAFIGKAIAVSDPIAQKLLGRAERIDNFIPLPEPLTPNTVVKSIAFVGRLSHEKGPDRFLQLAQQNPSLTFSLFGRGPMLEEIKSHSPQNLIMHTNVNSMDDYWQDIDLLCITSRQEGLPLVAIEAMSRGISVVSFPIGGLPSLISHFENGYLLTRESVSELSTFLHEYYSLPKAFRRAVSDNARATISANYSTEALVPRVIATYQSPEMEVVA